MSLPRLNAVDSEPWVVIARSAIAVSGPADTNENPLATVQIPGGAMGPNGIIRVSTQWTMTNNANAKSPRIRFGGASFGINNSAGNIPDASVITRIHNRGATNAQVGGTIIAFSTTGSSGNAVNTAAIDTLLAQLITITCQKAVGADTVTLENYLIELLQGA